MSDFTLDTAARALGVSRERCIELAEAGRLEMTSVGSEAGITAKSAESLLRPSAGQLAVRGNRRRHGSRSFAPTRRATTRRR